MSVVAFLPVVIYKNVFVFLDQVVFFKDIIVFFKIVLKRKYA